MGKTHLVCPFCGWGQVGPPRTNPVVAGKVFCLRCNTYVTPDTRANKKKRRK